MKRKVKLIAVDNRYKDTPYPFLCVEDESIGTYLTGQHIDPNDPDTYDNLTVEEMTGKQMLSPEKKKRFPFVINPLNRINFMNLQTFDLTKDKKGEFVNPKDAALVNLLKNYTWFVAPEKDKAKPKKHFFYIHDEIEEAQSRVSKADKVYQATRFIREELAPEGLFDTALVLNYKVKSFKFDPNNYSDVVLKDRVLSLCETNPEAVLECKSSAHIDEVFILKLVLHNFIKLRGTDFYDGSKFIGKDLNDLKRFIKQEENTMTVSKWNRLLAQKEGRTFDTTKEPSDKQKELFEELEGKSLDELKAFAGSKRYAKAEWGNFDNPDDLIKYLISKVK